MLLAINRLKIKIKRRLLSVLQPLFNKGAKLFHKLGKPHRTLITVHCRSPSMDVYGLSVLFVQFMEQFYSCIKTRRRITANVTGERIWMGSESSVKRSRNCWRRWIFLCNITSQPANFHSFTEYSLDWKGSWAANVAITVTSAVFC